jgi:hypothetical protein
MSEKIACEGCIYDMPDSVRCALPWTRLVSRECIFECPDRSVRQTAAGPWQPGATAPKDGRAVLAMFGGRPMVAAWRRPREHTLGHWAVWGPDGDWEIMPSNPKLWAAINLPEAGK